MINKYLFSLFIFIFPAAAFSQITKTAAIPYTTGTPTHTPSASGSAWAIDNSTLDLWVYYGGAWNLAGERIQTISGCAAPAYTPGTGQSLFVVNGCDSLYYYRSGAWRHVNKYTAPDGNGIYSGDGTIQSVTTATLQTNGAMLFNYSNNNEGIVLNDFNASARMNSRTSTSFVEVSNNKVTIGANGPVEIINGGGTSALRIREPNNGAEYTELTTGEQAANISYRLPVTNGTNGQFLQFTTGGNLQWAAASGGGGFTPQVYEYTTAGTSSLAIPPGATMIEIVCIGGGGGGGSGRQADNGANRFGGGGGSGGGWSTTTILAAGVTGPLSVVVGAGGAGGAAITTANTNGNNGNNGNPSRVDSNTGDILVYAGQGNGGTGGSATSSGGGGVSTNGTDFPQVQGGAGSSSTPGSGSSTPNKTPSGGGGGGGLNASNTQSSGGNGGNWNYSRIAQTNQGTTSVPNATAGATPTQGQSVGGGGGGGGASQSAAAGGNGGAGTRGGGGGGGGASATGFNSGAGGNGGAGYVRVIFY